MALFIEEDEDVLLAVWTATGAATAAVPKVRRGRQRLRPPAHGLLQVIQQAAPVVCLLEYGGCLQCRSWAPRMCGQ